MSAKRRREIEGRRHKRSVEAFRIWVTGGTIVSTPFIAPSSINLVRCFVSFYWLFSRGSTTCLFWCRSSVSLKSAFTVVMWRR